MNGIVTALLLSLVITLITELILAVLLGVRGIDLVVIGLANCVTNPIVNYCYDWALVLSNGNLMISSICLFLLEAFAVICEALLFRALLRYRKIRPVWLSLILNASSFSVGLIITLIRITIG